MRVKQASSVALFLMFLLLGQSIAANLNQIPSENVDTSLDSSAIVMASNNSSGNNTGGNNSGGNGNNTGGNNTGGNNTGGNNSGGNNTGSNNDSHCLIVDNVSVNTTYVATLDLVNICNYSLNYPGVNASANHPGVSGFYNGTEWYYLIGSNGTYNMSWQLSFDQSVANGSYITLYFEATILNCGGNNSYHDCPNSNDSTLTHQFFFISNSGNSGNNTGGNNTGGNSPVITVTGATNNSSYQVSNWNFNYSVSNYEGDVYWNATSENGQLYSTWSTYVYSISYQTSSNRNFYQNGNYTVCASINSQVNGQVNGSNSTMTLASDCMAIYVHIPPPSISIDYVTNYNNSSNQYSTWNFDYSVSSYDGDVYWNATSENGQVYSTWSTYVYSISYQTSSNQNFYQSGNYTVCASISPQGSVSNDSSTSSIASDCETIYVYVPPGPVDCGNTSYILIRSNSSVYNAQDVITFSVLVQCGSGENTFTLRGEVSRIDGNQNWNYTTLDYYQFSSNLNNSIGNEMYFTFDETSTSGEYMAQFYIGDASNIIGWVQWNFTVYGDDDNDGVNDQTDNCIEVNNPNQSDLDGDGLGDACDLDIDGDGVDNQNDALPNNGNETIDTDNDGLGDNADDDDDGDGMNDSNDAFPTDPTEQSDLDGDGVGDNIDADDDGDGITDTTDNCPLIVNPDQADLDGDGVGTACDGIELSVDENGTISGDGTALPSIGVFGTIAAISAGFIFATRREDEE